jgi:hypothetical protein
MQLQQRESQKVQEEKSHSFKPKINPHSEKILPKAKILSIDDQIQKVSLSTR